MKIRDFFFWIEPLKLIFIETFGWAVVLILIFSLPVLRTWWWVLSPIVLLFAVRKFYLWWMRWDKWNKEKDWIMLEIVPPKEVLTPFKAMEDFFSVIWSIEDTPNWREQWCEGEIPVGPEWMSFEVVSKEGTIHFYMRCLKSHRELIESALYAHYPEIEISETTDYTEEIPKNVPNEEWGMYGMDFQYYRDDIYPIKTYQSFFEEKTETEEEKRIDPIASLIEGMSKLGKGEHFWFQIILTPGIDKMFPLFDRAKEEIDRRAGRSSGENKGLLKHVVFFLAASILTLFAFLFFYYTGNIILLLLGLAIVIAYILFFAKSPEKAAEEERNIIRRDDETGEREMLLTPGEKSVISSIEDKIKKAIFKTNIRSVYLARKNVFTSDHQRLVQEYILHFNTANLNYMGFVPETRSKVHYIWRQRRKYVRQRKMMRRYINRLPPSFPETTGKGNSLMSAEELATIFHFPTKLSTVFAPSVTKVEVRKGGPPMDLPTEE